MLVGGIPTPLKNMKFSWDDDSQVNGKIKTCSKPPTRLGINPLVMTNIAIEMNIKIVRFRIQNVDFTSLC